MKFPKNFASFLFVSAVMLWAVRSLAHAGKVRPDEKDVTVAIYNLLPANASFTIHCKSKDDDLGTHVIPTADHYKFSFNVNFFDTTLFFCGVSWKGGQVIFDIYKAKRDLGHRCIHYCYWDAKAKGVEGFPESTIFIPDIVIPWS